MKTWILHTRVHRFHFEPSKIWSLHPREQQFYSESFSPIHPSQFASLLRSFGSSKRLFDGMSVHACIIHHGLHLNAFLLNLLIQMYGQCGALDEASAVFASSPHRDHFAWNFLIRSHAANRSCSDSIHLYQRMLLEGILPDRFILVGILSLCTNDGTLFAGKTFHACTAGSGLELDAVIVTAFMIMYAKCGGIEDAQTCFDRLPDQDVVSFNAMITMLEQCGKDKDALQLFKQMLQHAVLPERVTYLNTLPACASEEALTEGLQLHACCKCTEFKDHVLVVTALVSMYGKCGSLEDARMTFDAMTGRDIVSWNAVIGIYAQSKNIQQALRLVEEMRRQGVTPDSITFICILDACANQGIELDEDWIRDNIKETTAGSELEVGMSVMNMYSNCGNLKGAWETFNAFQNRNTAFYNAMISAFVKNRKLDGAFQVMKYMYENNVVPNKFTYAAMLDGCATEVALDEGRVWHGCIIIDHLELDAVISTSTISMYSKCRRLDEAYSLFERISERTVVSWNVMISGYNENSCEWEAIQLFQQMLHEGMLPNDITILCVLDACSSLNHAQRIHSCIVRTTYASNTVLGTACIGMYSKCGSTSHAQRVFNDLPERDTVTWSAMISVLIQDGQNDEAVILFNQLLEEGVIPDIVTYASILCAFFGQAVLSQGKQMHARLVAVANDSNVIIETPLICMYCKCGRLDEAWKIFDERFDRGVASWSALMCGMTQIGHRWKAFQLYEQLQQEGLLPNNLTFVSILDACSEEATLTKGHQIHSSVFACNLAGDIKVETALVNMYAKCGSLNEAEMVFFSMSDRNIVSWTTIITAHAQHGHGENAFHLLRQMLGEGLMPNRATFVSIFSACSHTGLFKELKDSVDYILFKTSVPVSLDLYNCTIDFFGRAGRLDEAEALIANMPHDPTPVSWTTLLGACRNQVDVDRGERAAKQLLRLESQNAEPYVALSNIYAAAGMVDEAQMVLNRMRGQVG